MSDRVPDLQECFDNWRQQSGTGNNNDQTEEHPHEEIEVRLRLNQTSVPDNLIDELKSNNMNLTQPNPSTDIIIVSGIPPFNGFGEQQVLEIVRRYAPNAELAQEILH